MAEFAVRHTQELFAPVAVRAASGASISAIQAAPGASVLIRRTADASTADVYTDRTKGTAVSNPVPTGVPEGSIGLSIFGNLNVFLDPDELYETMITVGGTTTGPFPMASMPRDPAEPIAAAAVEEAMLAFNVATQTELDAVAAAKQDVIPPGTYDEANVPEIDVWHSSFGTIDLTGAVDARAALAAANAAGANKRLRPGIYRVSSAITLTGGWKFPAGAILKPDSGVAISLQLDALDAPVSQIFDTSAGGTVVVLTTARLTRVYAEWWGAVGDGVADDTVACTAAQVSAKNIKGTWRLLHNKTYGVSALSAVNTCRTQSRGGTLKKIGTSVANWIGTATNSLDVTYEGITFDANGLVTTTMLRPGTGSKNMTVRRCKFIDAARIATNGFETRDTAENTTVEDCEFDGPQTPVFVNRNPVGVYIRRNRMKNWKLRGIYVAGISGFAPKSVYLEGNRITDVDTTGTVRQPIAFVGVDDNPFVDVHVIDNYVEGPNLSNTAGTGTADNISLHRCVDFVVRGNKSYYGGDVGITISQQSRDGVVSGNICVGNDVCGIALGSDSATYVRNIVIFGNVCKNNGQNRNADRSDQSRTGVRMSRAEACVVTGNVFVDDQGTPTQKYGISYRNSTSDFIGGNVYRGLGIANTINELSNVNVGDSMFDASPVARPAANPDTSGATLTALETEVNEIKAMLRTLGALTP